MSNVRRHNTQPPTVDFNMSTDSKPAIANPIDHLRSRLANRLETLNDAKTKYRRYHSRVAFFLILLAACNTAVVTLSQTET